MSQIESGLAAELGNRAIPLDRAIDAFSDEKNFGKIRRNSRKKAEANANYGKANFQKVGKNADAFFDAIAPLQASLEANALIRTAKEQSLIERLRSGELHAFGFPVHLSGTIDREQIPAFMFERSFAKWSERMFVGHGRKYADVMIHERTAPFPSALELPKPVGAPSFSDQLTLIAVEIARREIDLTGQPIKVIGNLYRDIGRELGLPKVDKKRPSNETVRRFLVSSQNTKS